MSTVLGGGVGWASLKPKLQFKAKFREERRSDEQKRKALADCEQWIHVERTGCLPVILKSLVLSKDHQHKFASIDPKM